jgi:sugar (pentulose or hexulose) kinase
MKEKVIAIFDVGKTNKKLLLFDYNLRPILEQEIKIREIFDEDNFECDNIELIEKWIEESVNRLIHSDKYDLKALNFATYGASIVYLDAKGRRFGPLYNYLKPIDERIPERLYRRYGGQDEFCRRTASPALGMLNSGIQIFWLKTTKPEIFSKVRYILHLPQYLSYKISGKICSEHTSIGCHTGLWDFDNMKYHPWTKDHELNLPEPVPVDTFTEVEIEGKIIKVGIGIHDSSSSLAPYFTGNRGKFILISTGTWCINMNPFNNEKLTVEQLDNDCLCYLSIARQPVKSSRLFIGKMHDTAVKLLNEHFRTTEDFYKSVKYDRDMVNMLKRRYSGDRRAFFESGPGSREFKERIDLFDFKSFDEGYHQLMSELCELTYESIKLILPEWDETKNMYITGGFGRNTIFIEMLTKFFLSKKVFTSVIVNPSAMGAALVIYRALNDNLPEPDLGLSEYGT